MPVLFLVRGCLSDAIAGKAADRLKPELQLPIFIRLRTSISDVDSYFEVAGMTVAAGIIVKLGLWSFRIDEMPAFEVVYSLTCGLVCRNEIPAHEPGGFVNSLLKCRN